jgi:O-antigen/teichoic acid export membrane protein
MGWGGLSSSGLIFGILAGQSIAAYGLSRQTVKQHRNLFSCISKMKIIALSRKYKKLPLFNLPNAFIDGLRLSGINILIAHIFTSAVLGQFSLAWRMVQAPMSLIGRSLSHVFFQKLSTAPRSQLHHIIKTFLFKAILLALPIFLMVYFFSEAIFILVFGEQWKIAGEAASIMAPWLFLNFLTSPVSTVFIVLDRQEAALGFAVVFMLTPLLILSFFSHLDFLSLLSMVSLAMSSLLLIFIGIVFYVIRQEKQKIL